MPSFSSKDGADGIVAVPSVLEKFWMGRAMLLLEYAAV